MIERKFLPLGLLVVSPHEILISMVQSLAKSLHLELMPHCDIHATHQHRVFFRPWASVAVSCCLGQYRVRKENPVTKSNPCTAVLKKRGNFLSDMRNLVKLDLLPSPAKQIIKSKQTADSYKITQFIPINYVSYQLGQLGQ